MAKKWFKSFLIFYAFVFGLSAFSFAQVSSNELVHSGKFKAAYFDTVVLNPNQMYQQFNYHGASPLFVQVWHPSNLLKSTKKLQLKDFTNRNVPLELTLVYENLKKEWLHYFTEYNLKQETENYTDINFAPFTLDDVLAEALAIETQSCFEKLKKKSNFPVIVYHHGTQGLPFENYQMAEFFASHGFIFVAANFHWPYSNKTFGLEESTKNNWTAVDEVLRFAKSLTNNKNLFYIGHSWGAQVGWCFLPQNKNVTAFVSLETTIEPKTDSAEVKDKWPFVYEALVEKKQSLNCPVLAISNTQKEETFYFFRQKNEAKTIFVSAKNTFDHESYHSIFYTRYFLQHKFKASDADFLKSQWDLYVKNLEMIKSFLDAVIQKKEPNLNAFKADYFISVE